MRSAGPVVAALVAGLAVAGAAGAGPRAGTTLPYFVGGRFASDPAPGAVAADAAPGLDLRHFQGDPRAALEEADRRLQLDRSRPETWVLRGRALAELGRSRPAVDAFEEALRLDAHSREARVGLGRLLVEGKDPTRGAGLLQSTLTRSAADLPSLLGLAQFHRRREEGARARAYYEAALSYDPVSTEAHHGLGTLDLREGRTGDALKRLRKVTELDPRHSRAWIAQALIYARLKESRRAVAAYARAWHALGGEGPAAREVLQRLRELDPFARPADFPLPDPPVRAEPPPASPAPAAPEGPPQPAAAREAAPPRPRPGEGIDLSSPELPEAGIPGPSARAREQGADASGRLARMAELYVRHQLYEEATSTLHARIALDPDSADARQSQARIEELAAFRRPEREERISHLRALADFLRGRRDRRGAREALSRVLLLDPRDHLALKDLAYLAARDGELAEALDYVERCLARAPGFTEALLIKAYTLARQRKFQAALVLYRAVLEGDPPARVRLYAASMERALAAFSDGP